jgi:hypothetical protein
MEKYRLVQEHKGDGDNFLEPTASCEVRITQQGKPRNYISYAMSLFVRYSSCCLCSRTGGSFLLTSITTTYGRIRRMIRTPLS